MSSFYSKIVFYIAAALLKMNSFTSISLTCWLIFMKSLCDFLEILKTIISQNPF